MELKDSDNFIVGQVEALEIEMHQSLFAIKFVAWSVNVGNSHTVPKIIFSSPSKCCNTCLENLLFSAGLIIKKYRRNEIA